MPIVSSSYTIDAHAQRDGSRHVQERHVFADGRIYEPVWRAVDKVDVAARVAARVIELEATEQVEIASKADDDALRAKLATVLDSAIKDAALTGEEAEKLGLPLKGGSK